jgi:hypothetical protein
VLASRSLAQKRQPTSGNIQIQALAFYIAIPVKLTGLIFMTIRNMFSTLGEYFKQVSIQVVGAVSGAVLVGLITGYILSESSGAGDRVEVITRGQLRQAIEDAKVRIIATGYVVSDIDADLINRKPNNFVLTLVMVDPLGEGGPDSNICQRQSDEEDNNSQFEDYDEIIKKLKQFHSPAKTGALIGSRLKLGVVDLYPTMAVMMVDNDLYAYFYPYGQGSDSPVIKFNDYWTAKEKDKRGEFFDQHLNKLTLYREKVKHSKTKFLVTDVDFKVYEDQPNPCLSKSKIKQIRR